MTIISKYSRAKLFFKVGSSCETFARFSTVAGEMGSPDTARDPREFSVKFYTDDGNWDRVGNNTPGFFIRDALKFSDFIHSQKCDPRTAMRRVPKFIQVRRLKHFHKADPDYGKGVEDGLGVSVKEII